ncbi:sensor histidine kinase [Corynebacterium urealyticum]|uniref:histidine kinase n=1 Tax=Corynebacterium urealyticum TaxID=43771 RepID=A0A5D4FXA9_9CORY|nr:HAMP domain-containing sensor histidine kinase [Corynebacterium urealyticum]TYR20638.1 HAMP domain-containing histidine kinase [Corynebacterium urealyticum]WOH95042.1 HAMP domain-containing sensor histidine kinase [Corynebacterium urealyticum]
MKLSLRARITVMFLGTVLGVGLALIGLVYAYLKLTPVPFMAQIPTPDEGLVIDGAVPIADEVLRRVLVASLTVLALLTAVAGVIGWFVAGLVIKPLRDFADDAATVTRGDLSARISHQGPDDEVGELADALNAMLDELADALERQRRFASNASHELKTPIATIQTMADVALASGDEQVLRDTLGRVREVNARAADTVAALLQLANVDVRDRQELDLAALCRDIGRGQGVAVTAEAVTVAASPTLVRQAVENMVRNGITHGEDPSMTVAQVGRNAEITVESDGPQLDAAEARTWVEPFARAQRTSGAGQGLGLAIVDAIAKAHGGSVELRPRVEGGLAVTLRLPV